MKKISDLHKYIEGIPEKDWADYASQLANSPRELSRLLGHPFPKSQSYFRSGKMPKALLLRQELIWAATICSTYKKQINEFLSWRLEYEDALMNSRYGDALEVINSLESQLGLSLWAIEAKLSVHTEARDEKSANSEFQMLSAKQPKETHLLTNLLVSLIWVRSNVEITENVYVGIVNRILDRLKATPEYSMYAEYVRFKSAFWSFRPESFTALSSILNMEAKSPILDRYLTLTRVCQTIIATGKEEDFSLVQETLSILQGINDYEMEKIREFVLSENQYYGNISTSYVEYCSGNMESSLSALETSLQSARTFSANDLILSRVRIATQDRGQVTAEEYRCLKYSINKRYEDFLLRTDNHHAVLEGLKSVIRRNSFSSWVSTLSPRIWVDELNEVPWTAPNSFARLFAVMLSSGDHQKLRYCPESIFNRVVLHLEDLNPFSRIEVMIRQGLALNAELVETTISCSSYSRYVSAWWAVGTNNYTKAIELLKDIVNDSNGNIRIKSRIFYLDMLIREDLLIEFIKQAARYYIETRSIYPNIPWTQFVEAYVSGDHFNDINMLPELAILLFAYDKHYGLPRKRSILHSIEDLLDYYKVMSPIEIPEAAFSGVDARIYFLCDVCTHDHLDGAFTLPKPEDVYSERIRICDYLTTYDSQNERRYKNEAVDLRELLSVRRLLANYNGAKIYVDEENIKRLFEEYGRQQLAAIKAQARLLPETIELFKRDRKSPGLQLEANLDYILLHSSYGVFRDLFVSEKRYGLNTALSVAIRHGIIDGKVKASISKNRLTIRALKLLRQIPRQSTGLKFVSEADFEPLSRPIMKLQTNIELALKNFKNSVLQMKLLESDLGLFDFVIDQNSEMTRRHLTELSRQIHDKTTFEDFCLMLFNQFWERTNISLKAVKRQFTDRFKKEVLGCFDQFLSDVSQLSITCKPALRSLIISSKNECNKDLQEVLTWFERGNVYEHDPFKIGLVIHTSLQHTAQIFPDIRFSLINELDENSLFRGRHLHPLLSTFNIIFENICTRSGLTNPKVFLLVECKPGGFLIRLENSVASGVVDSASQAKLDEIIEDIRFNDFVSSVDRDEGSGLRKVIKLISSDLNCSFELEAKFSGTEKFILILDITGSDIYEDSGC